MKTEQWAGIEGHSRYEVSSHGRVRVVETGRIRKQMLHPRFGYPVLTLISDEGKRTYRYIHRLVALAFVPNPEGLPQVNHLDGVKTNNDASNLEWVTRSGNIQHAMQLGLLVHDRGEDNPNAHLTWAKVREIRARCTAGEAQASLAKEFGVSDAQLSNIIHHRQWREGAAAEAA